MQEGVPILYIGIGVAKCSDVVVILDDHGEIRGKAFSIPNSQAGLQRPLTLVNQVNPEQQPVVFGLEATSHYPGPRAQGGLAGGLCLPQEIRARSPRPEPLADERLSTAANPPRQERPT